MTTCIHFITIPDSTALYQEVSLASVKQYAKRIGATLNLITERKFPDYPVNYEMMQIAEAGKPYDWNLYLRAGVLLGEQLVDVTTICEPNSVATCFLYQASYNFITKPNIYFERDERDLGIGDTVVLAHKIAHEIWQPLPGSCKEYQPLIKANDPSQLTAYTLSLNMAKYGLKVSGIFPKGSQYDFITPEKLGSKNVDDYVAEMHTRWKTS